MKYNKEELEKLLIGDNLNYRQIGEVYGVSGVFIRKKCIQLGIRVPVRNSVGNKYFCKNCNKEIIKMAKTPVYCDNKCQGEYKRNSNIKHWLDNQSEFSNSLISSRSFIKPYLLEKQEHKCKICDHPDEWNNKPMVFILDHVDGNAADNRVENLRLICHNCDSQLETYKSKNKNSARTNRYLK